MAPDRPTGHGRLDDAALADRIRATATAVAERTAAPARDLDEPTILASPDHHRSPARLVGVAAACLLVVALVAGAVVALRDRTGQVTTDGTPSGPGVGEPGAGGLPRLLPTWVPEGYSLTETKVTPGPPPKASFLRRFERAAPGCSDPAASCPYGPGGPLRVEVRAASVDDPQGIAPPVTNIRAAQPTDINGDAGWINVRMDGVSSDPEYRGYSVTWGHGAVRASVTSWGASNEDTVRIARGVTVGGTPTNPTAEVAPDALPGTLQPTYAGPDLLLAMGGLPGQVGMARLVYTTGRQTPYAQGTPPARVEGVAPDQIFLTEYDAPIAAATPWWLPLTDRSQPTTVDGVTCVSSIFPGGPIPPTPGPQPWTSVYCADATTFVALGSSSVPRDDLERMAHSLRPATVAERSTLPPTTTTDLPTPRPDLTIPPSATAPGAVPAEDAGPATTSDPASWLIDVGARVLHDAPLADRVDLWVFEPANDASRVGEASGCQCWRRMYQAVAVTGVGPTTDAGDVDLTEVRLRVPPELVLWIRGLPESGAALAATSSTGEVVPCNSDSCPGRPSFTVPPAPSDTVSPSVPATSPGAGP